MANSDFQITGAVRWRGRSYTAGEEEKLLKAGFDPKEELERLEDSGSVQRLTTKERLTRERDQVVTRTATPNGVALPRSEILRQAREDAGEGEEAGGGQGEARPLNEVPIRELRGILAQRNDAEELRQIMQGDERATARPLYEARLEELDEQGGENSQQA